MSIVWFQGCLPKVEEWYQQQYFVFMLALFVAAILKLGILLSTVFSCISIKKRRQSIKSFSMKGLQRSENIYDKKLSGLHDEPITAKYIQPNNFYSPRVRNPRIFNTKPNEMVWELTSEISALEKKLEKFSDFLCKHQAESIMW